ncbi:MULTISPECIES: hypothetical protein [Exiguobacterium]|uniref:DUF5590 domain-containing protein n=1 Tax=Exiguobacterium alkaliphilum TaxID=1428684 RepID=A0ABT2KY77_9BACL|nr:MULTISPECIES: hypothetical protein [Exiguobacterium]MCT4795396.1 hypothetical protein [Exiguobacterium alkaliphilum]
MTKRIIIGGLVVLLVVATFLQVREIIRAYNIAYQEEIVPEATRVRSLTGAESLEGISRVTGENTLVEALYGYKNMDDQDIESVLVVDRNLGIQPKASDAYYELFPGREATEEEAAQFESLIAEFDEQQLFAQVISTHEARYVTNREEAMTFYKVFVRDVDTNEYVFFITEDGTKLDFHTRGFLPLRYF